MNFRATSVWVLLLYAFVVPGIASTAADYAGQFVLKLGTRNFIVLNLRIVKGSLTGSISRPRHSSLGSSFSKIGTEVLNEPITSVSVQQDHLHLIASNPTDPSDTDEFDLKLLPGGHASLTVSGIPIEPWTLARVPDSPLLTVATDWDPQRTYFPGETETDTSSPEMQRIMDADQKPRQSADMLHADWILTEKQDKERRQQVRELLSRGVLHTGQDFEQAAFVFQHGSTPEDYLLAHTLAMIAVARGNSSALWIAAATLDRYLTSIKQPQLFGTQFFIGEPWTQEPYNRTLISDELRRKLGVPIQSVQQKQLEEYNSVHKK
jgi:hypothetical protein